MLSHKIIKILEENIGSKNRHFYNNTFADMSPWARETKKKNKQVGLHQINKLLHSKETINKIKRQSTELENIFTSNTSNKELISKIYKELIQLNTRRTNNTIKKWTKDLNRYFSKEEI